MNKHQLVNSKGNVIKVNIVYLIIVLFLILMTHLTVKPSTNLWLTQTLDVLGIAECFFFVGGWWVMKPFRTSSQRMLWYGLNLLLISFMVFLTSEITCLAQLGEPAFQHYWSFTYKEYGVFLLFFVVLLWVLTRPSLWSKEPHSLQNFILAVFFLMTIGVMTFTILLISGTHEFVPFHPIEASYRFLIVSVLLGFFALTVTTGGLRMKAIRTEGEK